MKKIRIDKIENSVFTTKGFDSQRCNGCTFDDRCCIYGADVDKESYDLILDNREIIEGELSIKLDKCFSAAYGYKASEYLGGGHYRSAVNESSGYCAFHMPEGKGCLLYKLATEEITPRRIVPSVCRLYPLTWEDGVLKVSEWIPDECTCLKKENSAGNLFYSQQREVEEIFDIAWINGINDTGIKFRYVVSEDDVGHITKVVEETAMFNDEEVEIAKDLLWDGCKNGENSYYRFIIAEIETGIAGYACYARIYGTKGSFELYWIAVRKDCQGKGIGRRIMTEVEEIVHNAGGKRIIIATSSRSEYVSTKRFYERCGYSAVAVLQDYYDTGDHQVIYKKNLAQKNMRWPVAEN